MDRAAIYGNWRAQVVDNKDTKKFGRVLVWIPDLMPEVNKKDGMWARPANNPLGGRNMEADSDHHYMGTSYIPKKGSWVFIFFEGGNINLPYYFGALELENTTVLPECQVGSNYENKWVLLKTHEGRTIVMSDDPDDARTEITGKKRQLSSPPTGDTASVYTIDGNQTTILFDEREGKEKVLIRSHKGDFFHIDIDERKLQAEFESDIIIKTKGKFQVTAEDNIDILSKTGDISIEAVSGNIDIKADSKINQESGSDSNVKSGGNLNLEAAKTLNELAGGNVNIDGVSLSEQGGAATPADSAGSAAEASPEGGRDT
jgi:hypothetical protein